MRIKFRAWKKYKQPDSTLYKIEPSELRIDGNGDVFEYHKVYYPGENEWDELTNLDYIDYIIEQYTGLKDKNGVEIYEGDIVEDAHRNTGVVKFGSYRTDFEMEGHMGFVFEEDSGRRSGIDEKEELEIIGNIHEDKSLLEDK